MNYLLQIWIFVCMLDIRICVYMLDKQISLYMWKEGENPCRLYITCRNFCVYVRDINFYVYVKDIYTDFCVYIRFHFLIHPWPLLLLFCFGIPCLCLNFQSLCLCCKVIHLYLFFYVHRSVIFYFLPLSSWFHLVYDLPRSILVVTDGIILQSQWWLFMAE